MKKNVFKRIVSLLLCVALVAAYLPAQTRAATKNSAAQTADPSTMDSWKELFLQEPLHTEHAGTVWTDKSVLTDPAAFDGTGITMTANDSFLVALSAMGSTMAVTGMSNAPTDTMLVLDVSGSMNDDSGNNNVARELVDAANESIRTLLQTNANNRVGVVLYSGPTTQGGATSASDAVLILPLGRYTAGREGAYLTYTLTSVTTGGRRPQTTTTETVGVDPNVVYEGTDTAPSASSKTVEGGTYIQKGLALAMEQFTAPENSTTVEDPVLGTMKRKPILVLMSDGAPTVATNDFTAPGQIRLGDGTYTSAAIGFVTQLTAAYAKAQIESKYGTDSLFYTLGLGTAGDSVAVSVLDPVNSSTAIRDFWSVYDQASAGGSVAVSGGRDPLLVTKIDQALEMNYVDRSFSVSGDSALAEGLSQAFRDIVSAIQLQSQYFPTLVERNEDLSGYVSFVDKIGAYMDVTDIKGVLVGNVLYSGADLAKNFAEGANGGALGSFDAPTELGNEMVAAVQARLGLDSIDAARTLIGLAYEHGQLRYHSETDFSNYIGWYANAAGEFLGFWHEGVTTMPEPSGDMATDPAFIIRSYGYLGAVDEKHGVASSDMMYATVQVRINIATGEESVVFAVPAALIPVLTYEVSLDQEGKLADLQVTGAQHPIRLVYEVALDPSIDPFTVRDLVSADYLAANTDENGNISFYSNQYEADSSVGYGKVNTYSYFHPSRQNEKYYYLTDAPVYADTNGTLYEGAERPAGTMYRAYTVYVKDGASLRAETRYRQLSAAAMECAVASGDGSWHIPKGNVHVNMDGYTVTKSENVTGTLPHAYTPFVDAHDHSVGDTGYSFVVGATLGNNGKLTVTPATGIALHKTMAPGAAMPDSAFSFVITNITDGNDSGTYPVMVRHADGSRSVTAVTFEKGVATVALNAEETLYIGGMIAGTVYTVSEVPTLEYVADQQTATVTILAGQLATVEFVNDDRGSGSVTITKEVVHPLGSGYALPEDLRFTLEVRLSGIGTAEQTFPVVHSGGTLETVTTDARGVFTLTLAHEEQVTVLDLPALTQVTVRELQPGAGFSPSYWENEVPGDGTVQVEKDAVIAVTVANTYAPEKVYPVNVELTGTKRFTGSDSWGGKTFSFLLQRWDGEAWQTIATATASESQPTFDFTEALRSESFSAPGAYYYQVLEEGGGTTVAGVTYDATLHTFGILVADRDMDGHLEIDKVISYHTGSEFGKNEAGNWHIDISFHNIYQTTGTDLTLDVKKVLDNPSGSPLVSPAGFRFGLFEGDVLVAVSELSDGLGNARFLLHYEQADVGIHTYILRELLPEQTVPGMTYSAAAYTVVVEVTDNGDGTTSAKILSIDDQENFATPVFTNSYLPKAVQLPVDFVSKRLTGRDLVAGEFTFQVRDSAGQPVLTGTNNAEGAVIFPGTLQFDRVGTYSYTIVETSGDGNGITADKTVYTVVVTVTDAGGELVAAYSVMNVAGDTIRFDNAYHAQDVSYALGGYKTLTGRVLLNEEFTFVMAQSDGDGVVIPGGINLEARNYADGSFLFPAVTYGEAGIYYYVVSEKAGGSADFGIVYDPVRYLVQITVTDDLLGKLEVSDVSIRIMGGKTVEQIRFHNVYQPDPTEAQIPATKLLQGKVLGGGDFSFELYASDSAWAQGQLLETVSNDAGGRILFSKVTYDKAGTWHYLVKETHGGEVIDGVTYDPRVYRVAVEVTDDLLGKLHTTIHIYDETGIPQESLEFVNIYTLSGEASVTLEGSKVLENKVMTDGMFTFELYAADESFAISGAPVGTAVNENGAFRFDLTYTPEQIGTYYYVVQERHGGEVIDGIAYSAVRYYITVEVKDNGTGGVDAVATVSNGSENVTVMEFVNTYTVSGHLDIALSATKTLEGRQLSAGEFSFLLYRADQDFRIGTGAEQTVTNGADGSVLFDSIRVTAPGKYYFVILEDSSAGAENITYDTARYHVTAEVSDNGKGGLKLKRLLIEKVTDADTQEVQQIGFVNTYTPDPAALPVPIEIQKTVVTTGTETIGPEGFIFQLENMTLGGILTAVSDENGKAVFVLNFTAEDIGKIYTYKLTEVNDGREDVIYSDVAYNITIAITRSDSNTLLATITNNGVAVETVIAEFENIYDPQPDPDPDPDPTGDPGLLLWIAMLAVSGCGGILTARALGKKKED